MQKPTELEIMNFLFKNFEDEEVQNVVRTSTCHITMCIKNMDALLHKDADFFQLNIHFMNM